MFNSNPILIDYPTIPYRQKIQNYFIQLPKQIQCYIISLFPIIQWIQRYNLSYLLQDAIAGITVGMLIVPQGIAYAKIANLDPQYGLYTSFVGAILYCFFGTSKDISIGPITVVSLLVGQAVTKVKETHPEITGAEVAVCLSLFVGIVLVLIGLIRLGILVDFISEPAIAGYMTGSAITISMGQWPKVFGLNHISTHDSPYLIFINFFKHIKETRVDAAFGLVSLFLLYSIKYLCPTLSARFPSLKKPLFFLGIMRSGLIVILGTAISFAINQHRSKPYVVHIIQDVPAGFDAMAVPNLNFTILNQVTDVLPSIILILILEHVSVAKSFGRISRYTVNPNQEILAIGISNIIGSFFGAYPCTGAFSRTAVMSRSGAKTPIAGVFSGAVVVLALYALTPAFFYIPEAVLGAIVIHAVIDLISSPKFVKELWKSSVLETMIFVIAVVISCFMDVETAIYISIGLSMFMMLIRLARPQVLSLGRVRISTNKYSSLPISPTFKGGHNEPCFMEEGMEKGSRYIYVDETDANFKPMLEPLPPGLVVIQVSQSILYPNATFITERITDIIQSKMRSSDEKTSDVKPILEFIVLDFHAVDTLDATALHTLNALRNTFNDYAGGRQVQWHFCHVCPRVRQSLVNAGFGLLSNIAENHHSSSTVSSTVDGQSDRIMETSLLELLPKDNKYPAFHWDLETAIHFICYQQYQQQKNNFSSVTITVY